MEKSVGPWIADVIQLHMDTLSENLSVVARRSIPLYREMAPEVVTPLFAALYHVLAQTFRNDDMAPIRAYLEQVTQGRMRDGASAAGFISLAGYASEQVGSLIIRESANHPLRKTAALRYMETVNQNIRLILSEINLRLLTGSPPDAPPNG